MSSEYRGRFAPSPSGPLHFGSLVAAVASYLEARQQGGTWVVRIEDLDKPRVVAGASDQILRTLAAYGMESDAAVVYQSTRFDAHHAALHRLRHRGVVYPCACSRREIADSAIDGVEGPVYPGTCRHALSAGKPARALRVNTSGARVAFHDALQGSLQQELAAEIGDFVVYRSDRVFAYQLAVVVDDAEQGITDVVRGADLLHSTARQIYLQRLLDLPTPNYLHVPVALNEAGEKLSKQTGGASVATRQPLAVLMQVLHFLGQQPPSEVADLDELWTWAIANWQRALLPRAPGIKLEGER